MTLLVLNYSRRALPYLIFFSALHTTCSLNPVADKSITSSDVFNSISVNSANAVLHEGGMPDADISDAPSVSTQEEIRKGEELVLDITVPQNAQQLYISASSIKATYLTLECGDENNNVDGYFTLDLNQVRAKKLMPALLLDEAASSNNQTYTVKVETNQNTHMNSFDINIAYKSPDGISRTVAVPISVNALLPIHNQLRVGFRPPEADNYSLCIERPDGSQICYSNGSLSAGGCGECTISYDELMDVHWIDLPSLHGIYNLNISIKVNCSTSRMMTVLLMINNAGRIENYDLEADINQIDNSICEGKLSLCFSYMFHIYFYITDYGINQWNKNLKSGEDFSHANNHMYPFGKESQILISSPDITNPTAMSADVSADDFFKEAMSRIREGLNKGINKYEIQLVQYINTVGYLFSNKTQQAVDVFGGYAYEAIGMINAKLAQDGYNAISHYGILGSNGTKVFAANSKYWSDYMDSVFLVDGRAYEDAVAQNIIKVIGASNVYIYNTCGDYWALNAGEIIPGSIGNWDVTIRLKSQFPDLNLGLLQAANNTPAGHVSSMRYSYDQVYHLFDENYGCASSTDNAKLVCTAELFPKIKH